MCLADINRSKDEVERHHQEEEAQEQYSALVNDQIPSIAGIVPSHNVRKSTKCLSIPIGHNPSKRLVQVLIVNKTRNASTYENYRQQVVHKIKYYRLLL